MDPSADVVAEPRNARRRWQPPRLSRLAASATASGGVTYIDSTCTQGSSCIC